MLFSGRGGPFALWLAAWLLLGVCSAPNVGAATADEILDALEQMTEAELDSGSVVAVDSLVLEHHSLKLMFEPGEFCFFEPLHLNGDTLHYGAFYRGRGLFQFQPPVAMEREQLQRFFKSDSLNRYFEELVLLFDTRTYDRIVAASHPSDRQTPMKEFKNAKDHIEALNSDLLATDKTSFPTVKTIKNLLYPLDKPFLVVSAYLDGGDRVHYTFDQYESEEVSLKKRLWEPGTDFMELINSYSVYTDESYEMINGIRREAVQARHYKIDAQIDKGGKFRGSAAVTFGVNLANTQMILLSLHPKLTIDSVVGVPGGWGVWRYKKHSLYSTDLYLILDSPLAAGDSITMRFYYSGEVAEKDLGEMYVHAGSDWYPQHGFRQMATFEMNFKTPKDYAFVATGRLRDSSVTKDTVFTSWALTQPTANVSFNIGHLKKYDFIEPDVTPVEIYYSKDLHQELARALSISMVRTGRHMEEQVAEDIINSLRLFNHYFGPYPNEKLIVTEVLAFHGESFPGLLHLGVLTWINTDPWGSERLFRAHETAHQWWGSSVGYAGYHDQWLSEGLAEYSSLLYFQAAAGNDKFLDKLEEIRKNIFSNRKYIFGSGAEAGPIALGYRTSSTETEGDYELIIYEKAALVFHMLRNMMIDLQTMNEDRFFNMLQEFYKKFRGRVCTTKDFKKLTEKHIGINMTWFFDQWVYGTELPTYKFSYEIEEDSAGQFVTTGRVLTEGVGEGFKMYVPLEVEFENGKKVYIRMLIDRAAFDFSLPPLELKPKKIRLNPFESVLARVEQ
ncbi:MAG: M1 family aminopeptidase [candidate division Zixibacteria bacterium]|nr:M1 family aminopeptidase [candidate division Zixibacteria bacterium]